jgi:hypothetical protein
MESWAMISSDPDHYDCAVIDVVQANGGNVYLYVKRTVDNSPVGVGYLGT